MTTLPSGQRTKSPMTKMEKQLYEKLKEHRAKNRKVSERWIQLTARKIQRDLDVQDGTKLSRHFKASRGWFHRFRKRFGIKFRKRKSGKKNSTDDNIPTIVKWYSYFRTNVLPKLDERNSSRAALLGQDEQFTEKWGRFPPHMRYNMDQVPLPFVVSQDSTYTIDEDTDVQVAGHGKGDLRKRQFTMHIMMNSGEGELRDGYVELICRGKIIDGSRFSLAERSQWNKNVPMYFQKNTWMDRNVMALSAKRFNNHILERWGKNAKALLTCDNLDAHVFQGTKDIFGEGGRVFLFCFPPAVTEAIQPIDAGYGRSIRCAIGRLLDEWLMEKDNMESWEAGMTAGERRVLISHFVDKANKEALANDKARVSCFRRCGVLLTLDGTGDDAIKPQGCTKLPVVIPETVDLTRGDFNKPDEVLQPEDWDSGLAPEDSEIHVGLPADGAEDNENVAYDEVENEELPSEPVPLQEEAPDEEEDAAVDEEEAEHYLDAVDEGEALLIRETRSGRRSVPRKKCAREGY